MTADAQVLSAKLDLVLTMLAKMDVTGKPGLTQAEFARLIKKTPRTVTRMVKDRRIKLVKGLVPNSTVREFLS